MGLITQLRRGSPPGYGDSFSSSKQTNFLNYSNKGALVEVEIILAAIAGTNSRILRP